MTCGAETVKVRLGGNDITWIVKCSGRGGGYRESVVCQIIPPKMDADLFVIDWLGTQCGGAWSVRQSTLLLIPTPVKGRTGMPYVMTVRPHPAFARDSAARKIWPTRMQFVLERFDSKLGGFVRAGVFTKLGPSNQALMNLMRAVAPLTAIVRLENPEG